MDILKNEILPLFEVTQSSLSNSNNQLIETSINQYSLYVDLIDVFLNKSQQHTIQINENTLQYTIPLYYPEIILSGKGHYKSDIIINVYTKLNPDFVRVNIHDLLTFRPGAVSPHLSSRLNQYKNGEEVKFAHVDGSVVVVKLIDGQKLYKIADLGLPRPDRTRGCLYVWLESCEFSDLKSVESSDVGESSSSSSSDSSSSDSSSSSSEVNLNKEEQSNNVGDQMKLILEILNYHHNSNIY